MLTSSSFSTPELLNNDSFVLRVYLAKQVVPVIRKVTVMSWIGLLCKCSTSHSRNASITFRNSFTADLGGIFNLCLGLSMISIVEFFYYCTFRLYTNYKLQKALQPKPAWK